MFVLSWLAAKGVRNNLQPLLIFAGLCLPIFIAEPRNHHNKWAIIVFDAVPVITYASDILSYDGSCALWQPHCRRYGSSYVARRSLHAARWGLLRLRWSARVEALITGGVCNGMGY